jgi:hypothetical protein
MEEHEKEVRDRYLDGWDAGYAYALSSAAFDQRMRRWEPVLVLVMFILGVAIGLWGSL